MRRILLLLGAVVVAVVLVSVASGSAGSGQVRWVIRDLGTLGGKRATRPRSTAVVTWWGRAVRAAVGGMRFCGGAV